MNTTTQTTVKSNSLYFRASKTVNGKNANVTIRLDDQCKNGHQDFSVTGEIYEADKPKIDKYLISAGCCHDDILEAFPELQIFVDLHLCDFEGNHMCPVSNGFYHLKNGFNKTAPDSPAFPAEFCNYYGFTPQEFKKLQKAFDKTHFALIIDGTDARARWKAKANEAIKKLEEMTETNFVNDSKRSQWDGPSAEQIEEFKKAVASGYYTVKEAKKRERAEALKILNEKIKDTEQEINSRKLETKTFKALFKAGGVRALNNAIFYNHSNTLNLNWKNYDKLTNDELLKIISKIKLPAGVILEVDKK